MNKISFFLMTQKGYLVLNEFINKFGAEKLSYVVSYKDENLERDFYYDIEELCNIYNIQFFNKNNLDYVQKKEKYKIVIGWKWIIKESHNLIVLHDSILPKYRGFSPLVNMLINGEKKLGVTALRASSEYDKGNILMQKSVEIFYPIKIQNAIDIISKLYIDVVFGIYDKHQSNTLSYIKQDESLASYSLWRDENDYRINWHQEAETIRRFIHAVGYPYAGAYALANNIKVRIYDVDVENDVQIVNRHQHIGKIIFMKNNFPVIVCEEGLLKIQEIISDETQKSLLGKISFRTRFR